MREEAKMKLTPEQVEALDVGTVVGRLADLKNLQQLHTTEIFSHSCVLTSKT